MELVVRRRGIEIYRSTGESIKGVATFRLALPAGSSEACASSGGGTSKWAASTHCATLAARPDRRPPALRIRAVRAANRSTTILQLTLGDDIRARDLAISIGNRPFTLLNHKSGQVRPPPQGPGVRYWGWDPSSTEANAITITLNAPAGSRLRLRPIDGAGKSRTTVLQAPCLPAFADRCGRPR